MPKIEIEKAANYILPANDKEILRESACRAFL